MQMQWFEMYLAGLKSSADMMIATLDSVSRIQQQQLDMWSRLWLGAQRDAAEGLREVPHDIPPEQRAA